MQLPVHRSSSSSLTADPAALNLPFWVPYHLKTCLVKRMQKLLRPLPSHLSGCEAACRAADKSTTLAWVAHSCAREFKPAGRDNIDPSAAPPRSCPGRTRPRAAARLIAHGRNRRERNTASRPGFLQPCRSKQPAVHRTRPAPICGVRKTATRSCQIGLTSIGTLGRVAFASASAPARALQLKKGGRNAYMYMCRRTAGTS